jgi:transposase
MDKIYKYRDKKWLHHKYIVLEKSLNKIGKECGVSESTIRYWLQKYNIFIRRRGGQKGFRNKKLRKKGKFNDPAWMRELYIDDMMTLQEIADLCGVSRSLIRCRMIEFNIKIRNLMNPSKRTRDKMKEANIGKNNPNFGKSPSKETKIKQDEAWTLERRDRYRKMMVERWKDPGYRSNYSESMKGKNNPNFNNWASREPYCYNWTEEVREYIRNLYNRTCTICEKSILQNISKNKKPLGRLAVDHVDENKMQGCDDWEWRLTPLCPSCHNKMKKQKIPWHFLLQLLLINNKKHQTNFLFGNEANALE